MEVKAGGTYYNKRSGEKLTVVSPDNQNKTVTVTNARGEVYDTVASILQKEPITHRPSEAQQIKKDNTNPDHYKVGGIETWDYIKAKFSLTQLEGFALGNVIKYISRAEHKGKIEDLKKAKWYLDNLIKEIEKDEKS